MKKSLSIRMMEKKTTRQILAGEKKCRRSVKNNITRKITPGEKSSSIHIEEKGASRGVHLQPEENPSIDDKKDASICSSRKKVVDPRIKTRFHDMLLAKKGSLKKCSRANGGWNKLNLTRSKTVKKWTTHFQSSLDLRESLGRGC